MVVSVTPRRSVPPGRAGLAPAEWFAPDDETPPPAPIRATPPTSEPAEPLLPAVVPALPPSSPEPEPTFAARPPAEVSPRCVAVLPQPKHTVPRTIAPTSALRRGATRYAGPNRASEA